MSKMKKPEIDIIRFNESDVVVASVPANHLIVSNTNDSTPKNGTFAFGNKSYTTGALPSDFYAQLNTAFGTENIGGNTELHWPNPGSGEDIYSYLSWIISGDQGGQRANGTDGDYTWDGTRFYRDQ